MAVLFVDAPQHGADLAGREGHQVEPEDAQRVGEPPMRVVTSTRMSVWSGSAAMDCGRRSEMKLRAMWSCASVSALPEALRDPLGVVARDVDDVR